MPEDGASSNARRAIQPTEACGHDRKHSKKRHHKRKRDDTQKEHELVEQGTAADKKQPPKEKPQKRKRDDDSHKGNKLIELERRYEVVDADREKIKKRNHKKKRDGPYNENELIKQEMQYKTVAADKKKHTKIRHQKRKSYDSHKGNELAMQEIQSKAEAVDNMKLTREKFDKRERDYSHMENELLDHDRPSKGVSAYKKNRVKTQNSSSNDGSMKAAGSKAKTVFDKRPSSVKSHINKVKKTVRFSSDVEVFHSTKNISRKFNSDDDDDGLVRGKRFTKEEDQIIKDACLKYVEDHGLKEGVKMILNSSKHPETRGCWKKIGASIPWRPVSSVYGRASYIFRDRTEQRKWTPEEIKLIQRYIDEHGRKYKELANLLGVHRHQVKDAWRRNRLPNARKGPWSQDEYSKFFELVNEDLKMNAFKERQNKSSMIRENISWWAISDKMGTRYDPDMCMKWYNQLTSPMVSKGLWSSCDDYHLLFNLSKLDACCCEDVDWDNLLKNRDGVACRKRWLEMTKHIGGKVERTFMEQVELLASRYRVEVLPYRKISLSEPDSESEGSESE